MADTGMNSILLGLLEPERLTSVVDIGANPIDGTPPYKELLELGLCTVTGFEPQMDALQRLNQVKGANETYLPYAVGDGQEHTLRICAASGLTSLYEPAPDSLNLLNAFPGFGDVLDRKPIKTRRLDDIAEIEHIDFLKIDVQGSELSIISNGRDKLKNAIAIQAELPFLHLYEGQPALWEVDKEIRDQGFTPHSLTDVKRRSISPLLIDDSPHIALNQVVDVDIVYFRNFLRPDALSISQWTHLAFVALHCCKSPDLTLRALQALVTRGAIAENIPQKFIDRLRLVQPAHRWTIDTEAKVARPPRTGTTPKSFLSTGRKI